MIKFGLIMLLKINSINVYGLISENIVVEFLVILNRIRKPSSSEVENTDKLDCLILIKKRILKPNEIIGKDMMVISNIEIKSLMDIYLYNIINERVKIKFSNMTITS